MTLAAMLLFTVGIVMSALLVCSLLSTWLDGWEDRQDARRRNGAHRR